MQCPACGDLLVTLEFNDVEIDYCTACAGVWLDAGELELLLGRDTLPAWLTPKSGDTGRRGRRRCPDCGKKMNQTDTTGARSVTYDTCPRGHGMWLDAGELSALIEEDAAQDSGQPIRATLRGFFGKDNVEKHIP